MTPVDGVVVASAIHSALARVVVCGVKGTLVAPAAGAVGELDDPAPGSAEVDGDRHRVTGRDLADDHLGRLRRVGEELVPEEVHRDALRHIAPEPAW